MLFSDPMVITLGNKYCQLINRTGACHRMMWIEKSCKTFHFKNLSSIPIDLDMSLIAYSITEKSPLKKHFYSKIHISFSIPL